MTKPEIKDLSTLLLKIAAFILILFVADRGIGGWIEKRYDASPQGNINVVSHAIRTPNEEMYVFGSSLAVHSYNCKVFTDSLGFSCYNAGRENSLILYSTTIFRWMLKKHKPKFVILSVSPKDLQWRASETPEKVIQSMLMPYVLRDTSFKNMTAALFPEETKIASVSKLYAYNSMILPILLGHDGTSKAKVSDIVNGYLPLLGSHIKNGYADYKFEDPDVDEGNKILFEEFLKLAKDNNIPVVVLESPLYIQPFPETKSETEMKKICAKYDVPFWTYVTDKKFAKANYFYDNIHMNDDGGTAYSKYLTGELKKYFAEKHPELLK